MRACGAVVLAGGLVAGAAAQPPREPVVPLLPSGFVVALVRVEAVQKDLRLSGEQVEKVNAWSAEQGAKTREALRAKVDALKDVPVEKRAEALAPFRAEVNAAAYRDLEKILTPAQVRRLRQIEIQVNGPAAFQRPDVAAALKLTDAQKQKVGRILDDAAAKSRQITKELRLVRSDSPEAGVILKKLDAVRTAAADDIQKELTEEQRAAWKELTGAPFDTSTLYAPVKKDD